jgi:hypothetical protein
VTYVDVRIEEGTVKDYCQSRGFAGCSMRWHVITMKGLPVAIAALVFSAGLAWAECPTGLGRGITHGVDIRGVLTLTTCDQTWLRGVESDRRLRIKVGAMNFVSEPGQQSQLRGGGIIPAPLDNGA